MNPWRMSILTLLIAGACLGMLPASQDKAKDKKASEVKKPPSAYTDPENAPIDYQIQGEYVEPSDRKQGVAAQVVAKGNSKFDVYMLQGGLPGANWDAQTKKVKIEARLDPEKGLASFQGPGYTGTIDAHQKTLRLQKSEREPLILKRIERQSPTLGAKPPEGAMVLFDGTHADEWREKNRSGTFLGVPNSSKRSFKDFKLHLEFRTPFQPTQRGQGRGNSGVYVLGREVQVLDSFGLEGKDNECGALYGLRAPSVNMCLPPLVWQTYDIECKSGAVDAETRKQGAPTITVLHNGVLVHDNVELKGAASQGNIHLQHHGDPVVYRNIWVVERKAGTP